jgi:acyl-CoA synthetase (AMP-forming)/AMP-acid ligase II
VNLGDILRLPAWGDRVTYIDLRDPERPRELTAFELEHWIRGVAGGLRNRGIAEGDRVGILAANGVEFVAAYFGIMRLGAVAVPINHKLPPPTVSHIFQDSAIRMAFVDEPRSALVPEGIPKIDFHDFTAFLEPEAFREFTPADCDLAEILYTSGSTGLPKGVPLTHRGQLWAIRHYLGPFSESPPGDVTLVVAPLYHMNGLFFTTVALANRLTVISLPRFEARTYLQTVAGYRCTVLSGIPTMFALMVREGPSMEGLDLECVREISIGSAPLTEALVDRVRRLFPRAAVHNGFGTTEAGPAVFGPHPEGLPTPAVSLGYPLAGIDWKLVDGTSENEGVLALRTPALTEGYLNLPRVTAEKWRDGWYLTGDVMRRDAAGFFYFVGRADDMFFCGGENVYPGEVEQLLERHPQVAQAIVVPAPDSIKGQIPVAFVVARPGTAPTAEDIKEFALAQGPAYAHPRFVVFRDLLPLSGTHKIDRSRLVEEATRLARSAGRTE